MSTSAQVRRKLADVAQKRAKVDKDLSDAERRKATKEADAHRKNAQAARATSASTAAMYGRQAASSRDAAVSEGKKIALLSQKRSELSKEEARLSKDLQTALDREAAAQRQAAERDRRAREQEDRRRETQRRNDERRRQDELLRLEQQHLADRLATHVLIDGAERRLTDRIASLREPRRENLRILYATATPEGDLRVSQEVRRVKAAVRSALHRDAVEIEIAPDVTASDLLDYLTTFRPHIVHFSGHANADVLVFDDGGVEGAEHAIPIDAFMRAMSSPDQPPSLVVLNACESATNLEHLLAGVPLAIGMAAPVGDPDAITFATRFYRGIADGQSVQGAMAMARADMELNGMEDYELPTLIAAPGIDPAAVYLVLRADA